MEIDYGALFGVELEHGAEGQEVADPAENQENPAGAGAEGQEVAEPAEADSQEQTVAETAAGDQDGLNSEQPGQSAEENARYAAARRKAEQERDAAIERAYDKTILKCKELKWPYMNKILTSWHEKGLHTLREVEDGDRPAPRRQTAPGLKSKSRSS